MTFEKLRFEPAPDGERTDIIGFYQGTEATAMRTDPDRIYIGGILVRKVEGQFELEPGAGETYLQVAVVDNGEKLEVTRYE
jgi:hypothetical protein